MIIETAITGEEIGVIETNTRKTVLLNHHAVGIVNRFENEDDVQSISYTETTGNHIEYTEPSIYPVAKKKRKVQFRKIVKHL